MNNNGKVVAFGELMLRLTPPGAERFVQADRFEAVYGGGEANVAVSCSNFGLDTEFVTRLPAHADEQNRLDFFHEIEFMKRLGYHTHIIR